MRRRRLLMISGNGPNLICGISDYTANLLETFQHLCPEWDWMWLCRKPRWFDAPISSYRNLQIIRPTHTWNFLGINLVTAAVCLLKPDLIHIQDEIYSYFETDAAVQIAKAAKCPVVVTLHEFHTELSSVHYTIKLVKNSDVVITNDNRTTDRCRQYTGRNPNLQGWSPANVLPLKPEQSVKPVPGLLTTFGLISKIKQLPILFEALKNLRQQGANLHWRIIGPFNPTADTYHAELAQLFNEPWVEFTGGFPDVRDGRLRTLLAESDAMILAFADGASPRRGSLQAAWAFGLPVITTVPPVNEVNLQHGVNCFLVKESTPQAWSAAIRQVQLDRELREQLSFGSRMTAEHFSWEKLATLHLKIFNSLLN